MTGRSRKPRVLETWRGLYTPLESGFYVPPTRPQPDSPKVVVRDMIVDMEELNTRLRLRDPAAGRSVPWETLEVYADILVLPLLSDAYDDGFAFKLGEVGNQQATFFARSIVITDEAGVFMNYNQETRLAIFAQEIEGGTLTFAGVGGDPRHSVPLQLEDGAVGFSIRASEGRAVALERLPDGMVGHGAPAYWILESSFNVASTLAASRPDLASSLLSWTSRTASFGDDIDSQHLALNAANLKGVVTQMQRKIPFVPPLSEGMYKDVTTAYLESAASFETEFNTRVAQLDLKEDLDGFVKANQEYFTDQTGVAEQLVEQMKGNVTDAETLLEQNSRKLHELVTHDGAIDKAKEDFRQGVRKYKKAKENEAIAGVCMAIVEVGGALARMAAGDESAAPAAAQGAANAAKAGKEVAETAGKLKKLVETMKKIFKVAKQLGELAAKLKAAQEAIEKLVDANGLRTSDFGKGIRTPAGEGEEMFDNAYWEAFKINIDGVLTPYAGEIDGASAYLEQLRYLGVYGEAVFVNSAALTQLRQRLFQLVLEEAVAKKQRERLNALVGEEESQRERLQRAKILTYQGLLRVKSRVVIYMNEQAAALRYWAVRPELPSKLLPSLGDSVGRLREKLARLDEERVKALKHFQPTPQPMDLELSVPTELIERLKTLGRVSWTIPLTHGEFDLFGRVRVRAFRVYLNDEAVPDPSQTVRIKVSTSGHYCDRYKGGRVLHYVSTPIGKPFEYKPKAKDRPVADGTVADSLKFSYFEPTPFTTWTFQILNPPGELDLSKLTELTLKLQGSWAARS